MALSVREYRARIKSTESMKKITRAMELIAASRIIKAQKRAAAAAPYSRELTRAVSAVATFSNVDHALVTEPTESDHVSVVAVTIYTSGRKAAAYFKFRNRAVKQSWAGYSDQPTYDDAREIANTLIEAFTA